MPRRAIQRERKRTTSTNKSTTNMASEEATQMINTQIVKVIVQQPKKKVTNRKPRTEKRDSNKKLAIDKLKQALEIFRQVKERAQQAKITIPASVGEMPLNIGDAKTVSDIDSLTSTIMLKTREIEALILKKEQAPKYFGMPEFTSKDAFSFASVIKSIFPRKQTAIPPIITPYPVSNLESKLSAIEKDVIPTTKDSLEIQSIQQQRQSNIQNILQTFNTKKQAIGMQLAAGKITQEQYDKQIQEATKEYNDELQKNNIQTEDKITKLKETSIGADTLSDWSPIENLTNVLRNRIRGINSLGNVDEREIVELEEFHTDLTRLFNEFSSKHRTDIEEHLDLLPGYNSTKTMVDSSIRSLIRAPVKNTTTPDQQVKDALKRLEEVNQMYNQLREDVNRGIDNNPAAIRNRIANIEKYHDQVKAINLKEGVPPTHNGLAAEEAHMEGIKQEMLNRQNNTPPVISENVKKAIRRLEEVNQMYLQLKEDVERGLGDNAVNIRAKITNIEGYHDEVKALNLKSGVQPNDPGLRSIEATLAIEKRELLGRHPEPSPQPTPQPTIPQNIRKAISRLEEISQMYLQLKEDLGAGLDDNIQSIRARVDQIEIRYAEAKALNLKSGVQPNDPALRPIEAQLAVEKQDLLSRHSPQPQDIEASRGKLTSYVKQDPGWTTWRNELSRALADLGWNTYRYTDPNTNQSKSFLEVSRGLKRELLNALLGGLPIPPRWSK
jgi:hypothetical protein